LEYKVVTSFLNEVARNDLQKISKVLKVDKDKVQDAINNIKKLNPRPASTVLSKETERIIPDLVAKVENKKIRLELNKGALPDLRLYNPYEKELDIIKDPEARKFLKENMDAAKHLIDNLRRRETTICDVAHFILDVQRDALHNGRRELKTLTIKDVAQALDFHPSTISRAVSNKYIQVNDEVMPLKNLLSHGIKKENGETESKMAVKSKIEEIIKAEDRAAPLSDAAIQKSLATVGVTIKRRTVAKYRKSLRILPTYLRKKTKAA
jgi:RNA polymerase sigma-54 factor